MDTKNVIAAISLSAAVIILYGLFFAPPPPDPKQIQSKENTTVENTTSEAPSLDQNDETLKISRISAEPIIFSFTSGVSSPDILFLIKSNNS